MPGSPNSRARQTAGLTKTAELTKQAGLTKQAELTKQADLANGWRTPDRMTTGDSTE